MKVDYLKCLLSIATKSSANVSLIALMVGALAALNASQPGQFFFQQHEVVERNSSVSLEKLQGYSQSYDKEGEVEYHDVRMAKLRTAVVEFLLDMKRLDVYNAAVAQSHSSVMSGLKYQLTPTSVKLQTVNSDIVSKLNVLNAMLQQSDAGQELYDLLESLYISATKESEVLERDTQRYVYQPSITDSIKNLVVRYLVEIKMGR